MQYIENRTFDEIAVGDTASIVRTLKTGDVALFAATSAEVNPAHVDDDFARSAMFHGTITHGMWGGALVSAVLGTELPGPGTVCLDQSLRFRHPVGLGDTVDVRLTVTAKDPASRQVTFECRCTNQDGTTVIDGQATVIAPAEKIRRPRAVMPAAGLPEPGARYRDLVAATRDLPPVRTAVIHPCDALSLGGAIEAASQGMIVPVLVGPRARIEAVASETGLSLDGIEIVEAPHSHAAAERGVALIREGKAGVLMKGKLHTDELMAPVVDRDKGLRTERRMSHIFALDVPHYPKPLFVTDAAINIFPDLDTKRDIVQNAIDLAHALGIERPKVAVLAAVETVYPKMPSTIEAAALCKMLDRGQITGGVIDGPLAFDNAVSKSAAAAKGIASEVAGDADILVVPDLEAGNMIAKQLVHLAGAEAAGIVLGARVPIVLTSRSDGVTSRLASCAMAQLVTAHQARLAR